MTSDPVNTDVNTPPSRKPRGANYILAGSLLTIAAGFLALVNGLGAIMGDLYDPGVWSEIPLDRYTICGVIVTAFGTVAIIGGIAALRTRNMIFALTSAGLGMAGDGVLGFFFGLTAIVLFFLSDENL